MTSDTDEPPDIHSYELYCTDCDFEAMVSGTVHDALDVADAHQDEYEEPLRDHFVTFKLRGDGS